MYKSFSNSKQKQQRPQHLTVQVPMILPEDISEKVENEIFEILECTRFDKIPMAISAYRKDLDKAFDGNEYKTVNIGYIKSFNPGDENTEASFTIIIFSRNAESVKNFVNPAVEVEFIDRNEALVTMTKFNLIALGADDEPEEKVSAQPQTVNKPKPPQQPKNEEVAEKQESLGVTIGDHLAMNEKEVPDIS